MKKAKARSSASFWRFFDAYYGDGGYWSGDDWEWGRSDSSDESESDEEAELTLLPVIDLGPELETANQSEQHSARPSILSLAHSAFIRSLCAGTAQHLLSRSGRQDLSNPVTLKHIR